MIVNSSSSHTQEASLEELNTLVQWAAREGWNPGIDDTALFHASDASGFFISYADDRPAAGISLVKHSREHAFLGLYLCLPEYRGKGIGLSTWNHALTTVANRTIGLDGVVEQQDNYRQSGFTYHFGNIRYSGTLLPNQISLEVVPGVTVRAATQEDCWPVVYYDAKVGGFERHAFINALLTPNESRFTFLALEEDTIVGVAAIRKCLEGYKIGPLLANSSDIASLLITSAAQVAAGENIMVDVPDKNHAAIELVKSLKLQPIFETARMYRGPAPNIDLGKLFGVATLELG